MSPVKTPYDDDVVAAMENNEELPEGTVLNFYTRDKFKDRSVENLISHATENNPTPDPAPSKSSKASTSTPPSS